MCGALKGARRVIFSSIKTLDASQTSTHYCRNASSPRGKKYIPPPTPFLNMSQWCSPPHFSSRVVWLQCPLCHGKGYAYHLFGVYESEDTESGGNYEHNHHHHHHDSHGSRHCAARGNSAQGGGGGDREEGEGSMPGYAHAVNTTCKVWVTLFRSSEGVL